MRNFTKLTANLLVIGFLAGCFAIRSAAADVQLPVPQAEAERAYLGLPPGVTNFALADIRCEILVVDCFDMYCHLCQDGAEHVKELYDLAQRHGLDDRVKFIGLGVGDTPLEVAIYKDKFKMPFPLFPDRKAAFSREFGELRVPNLVIARKQGGRLEVIHRSPGVLLDPASLLPYLEPKSSQSRSESRVTFLQTGKSLCDEFRGCIALPATNEQTSSVAPIAH